jgi:hypothetical protein
MRPGARLYLVGGVGLLAVLASLAGCGKGNYFAGGERAAWREQAENECMKSGALKQNAGVVQISPIEGPGMCGATYPLKVAALGDGNLALSYSDVPRPAGNVPGAMPPIPVSEPRYQWLPGPPPAPPRASNAPMSIVPPGSLDDVAVGRNSNMSAPQTYQPRGPEPRGYEPPQRAQPLSAPRDIPRYDAPRASAPQYEQPRTSAPPNYAPQTAPPDDEDDIPDDAVVPNRSAAPAPRASHPMAPPQRYEPPRQQPSQQPRLGLNRPMTPVKAAVSPPATLACPIVSALDKWVTEGVQPAAMRWFGQPVVEIKQISSYSCRGMVGAGSGHISEHAFGNALDVAGFTLADGRKVMVKGGWDGAPEETGFLHDVHGAACEIFTTVLAPGYNIYHYDHIHVDLMRRASGRTPCRPGAVSGEVAAAKQAQKSRYAHRGDRLVTGAVTNGLTRPRAVAGEDGEFDDTTGSIGSAKAKSGKGAPPPRSPAARAPVAVAGEDGEFEEEN